MAISDDGKTAWVADRRQIRSWDIASAREIASFDVATDQFSVAPNNMMCRLVEPTAQRSHDAVSKKPSKY